MNEGDIESQRQALIERLGQIADIGELTPTLQIIDGGKDKKGVGRKNKVSNKPIPGTNLRRIIINTPGNNKK